MANLVQCKSCDKEVAKSAKTCPHCGQKLKGGILKKILVWSLGIFIALIVVGALLDGNNAGDDQVTKAGTSSNDTSDSSDESKSFNVGDILQTKKYQISIAEINSGKSVGGQYFNQTASEGAVYVAVRWNYKNITNNPIGAFSTPDIYLIASDGTKYDSDIGATSSYETAIDGINEKSFSDLNPGIKVRTAAVFEVSKERFDPASWKIMVDADQRAMVSLQ